MTVVTAGRDARHAIDDSDGISSSDDIPSYLSASPEQFGAAFSCISIIPKASTERLNFEAGWFDSCPCDV